MIMAIFVVWILINFLGGIVLLDWPPVGVTILVCGVVWGWIFDPLAILGG